MGEGLQKPTPRRPAVSGRHTAAAKVCFDGEHPGHFALSTIECPNAAQFRHKLYPVVYSDKPYDLTPWAKMLGEWLS